MLQPCGYAPPTADSGVVHLECPTLGRCRSGKSFDGRPDHSLRCSMATNRTASSSTTSPLRSSSWAVPDLRIHGRTKRLVFDQQHQRRLFDALPDGRIWGWNEYMPSHVRLWRRNYGTTDLTNRTLHRLAARPDRIMKCRLFCTLRI